MDRGKKLSVDGLRGETMQEWIERISRERMGKEEKLRKNKYIVFVFIYNL